MALTACFKASFNQVTLSERRYPLKKGAINPCDVCCVLTARSPFTDTFVMTALSDTSHILCPHACQLCVGLDKSASNLSHVKGLVPPKM